MNEVGQRHTERLDRDLIPPSPETRAGAVAILPSTARAFLQKAPKRRIAFLYLGRRGGVARLAYELAAAATRHHRMDPLLVVSESNELLDLMRTLPGVVRTVSTFRSGVGALFRAYRIPLLVQNLNAAFNDHRTEAIVVLASHVWSPAIAPFLKNRASRYIVVVHDADPHPGDITGLAHAWLLRDAAKADRLITLSRSVTTALSTKRRIPSEKIVTLFHPVMTYGEQRAAAVWRGERPLRLLFFGRMKDYKGVRLFVEAFELLHAQGLTVEATVAGEGDLKGQKGRLESLGVNVINRWLHDEELARLLATHDAIVLTHTEASQSGCAASALGSGRPVIATPVGGLLEQMTHQVNGLVADRVDAQAIAREITRIANDPALYHRLVQGVARQRHGRDMCDFLDGMLDAIPWNAN